MRLAKTKNDGWFSAMIAQGMKQSDRLPEPAVWPKSEPNRDDSPLNDLS